MIDRLGRGDGAQARARKWLDKHWAHDRAPTPLLVARLEARRRGEMIGIGAAMGAVVTYSIWSIVQDVRSGSAGTGGTGTTTSLLSLTVAYAVLATGAVAAAGYQRRADRRTAQDLRQRVAQPAATKLRAMLGGWFIATAVAIYGGGLLLGGTAAGFAAAAEDRSAAVVFLAGVVVYAGFGAVMLADAVRRPAIAADAASLVDDELLRREDAHRALVPYPAVLALVAGAGSRSGDLLLLAYLGYALATAMLWAVAMLVATNATAARVAARAVPQR